jgi:hypothetical protein
MFKITSLMAAVWCLLTSPVWAGTQVLGFEISVSTLEQVRSTLAKQTKVLDNGINEYSRGPSLKTNGAGYGIDGLQEVFYTFDEQKKLAVVTMQLSKDRFDFVMESLKAKYKTVKEQVPFVGDRFVQFKTSDATINVDSPHLRFDMNVEYVRDDIMKKYLVQSAAKEKTKRAAESGKF